MNGSDIIAVCENCSQHISKYANITSTDCRAGFNQRAWMFNDVSAIKMGLLTKNHLSSGSYTLMDVNCPKCAYNLGWKYEKVHDMSQRYKEGQYVMHGLEFVSKRPFRPRL